MGEEQRDSHLAISYAAHQEAHEHLSEAGSEVLEMMDYASRSTGRSITEVYVEATASLSERDKDIIKAYLARRTLIEAFGEEMVGEEVAPPPLMLVSLEGPRLSFLLCPGPVPLGSPGIGPGLREIHTK